jgi:hypothetical protein
MNHLPTEEEAKFMERSCPEALFLGPKAENMIHFEKCTGIVLKRLAEYRKVMMTGSDVPFSITEAEKRSNKFVNIASTIERELSLLCDFLYAKTPNIASPKYVAHMYGDISMPAVLGQLAAIFLQMNQVSYEVGACNLTPVITQRHFRDFYIGFAYWQVRAQPRLSCRCVPTSVQCLGLKLDSSRGVT